MALTVRPPDPPYERLDEEESHTDATDDDCTDTSEESRDTEDAEIMLYTSVPATIRCGSRASSSSPPLRRTSSPVATGVTDRRASKPRLCTPTLMQRAATGSMGSTASESQHPACLICLEPLPSGGLTGAPPVLVSNIPVRLVCNCTVHAHPACLERWLQRTLACPICHGAAQFQPRPGQVVRSSTHAVYQRLLEREEARQVDYVWEIRRRQCIHFVQCGCALTFLGALGWAFAAYSSLSSPSSG